MKRTPNRHRKAERLEPKQAALWQPSLRFCAAILLLVIATFAIIRVRLRDMSLERDEGEYAYAGQLMLQGIPPYQLAYNMKLPGTYAAYALIMGVLGQTSAAIHLGVLFVNTGTVLLMYVLAAQLFGRVAGLVAAASYGLLSTSSSVLGLAGHATHFVVLPAIAGLILLLKAIDYKRPWLFFLSGILLGLAFVMKQPGFSFAIFAGLYLLRSEWSLPIQPKNLLTRFGLFTFGVVIPYGLTCLIMWRAGVFGRFWFWTFSYARHYGLRFTEGFKELRWEFFHVVEPSVPIWLMAVLGLSALWWNAKARHHRLLCLGFLAFSFLAVCPGFLFTPHYFILLLPAVSLLVSVGVSSSTLFLAERTHSAFLSAAPVLLFLIAFAVSIFGQRDLFFEMDPIAASRDIYGLNPFPEALEVGEYLRSHSSPAARVAVLGSEPEIYFYSQRRSATGYIYTYALMEQQPYALAMQKDMISEIETASPEFVVAVNVPMSWAITPESRMDIVNWMQRYINDHYERVGVADIQGDEHTEYRWAENAFHYQPRSQYAVYVFRKKT